MKAAISRTRMAAMIILVLVYPAVRAAEAPVAIDETRSVSSNEKITLEVMRGEVVIRVGNDNTFRVSGTLDELAEGYELRSENGFTRFEVQMPRNVRGSVLSRAQESDLQITVPVNSSVEYSGVNAAVDIEGVAGGSRITTVNGDITASMLSGYIELRTVNGGIDSRANTGRMEINTVNGRIQDEGSEGRVSYGAVNGQIEIDSAAEEITASVVNGSIRAQLNGTRDLDIQSVNGEIDIALSNSRSPRISGSTVIGEIRLHLPGDVDARFSLRSNVGGRIINNITDDEVLRARFGPARSLNFSTGQGVGVVEMDSVSGRLELNIN